MCYANILTGGIGCGKSTIAKLLSLEGYTIIDADSIAHRILDENAKIIQEKFGNDVCDCNHRVNRAKLGEIIFHDTEKKQLLEEILHPLIHAEITRQCALLDTHKKPYFIEIPLYFESRFHYKARFVICVYAPEHIQLQRIMQRNGLNEEEAKKRIQSQIDIEIKKKQSDFVIDNSSDLAMLQRNFADFLEKFKICFHEVLHLES